MSKESPVGQVVMSWCWLLTATASVPHCIACKAERRQLCCMKTLAVCQLHMLAGTIGLPRNTPTGSTDLVVGEAPVEKRLEVVGCQAECPAVLLNSTCKVALLPGCISARVVVICQLDPDNNNSNTCCNSDNRAKDYTVLYDCRNTIAMSMPVFNRQLLWWMAPRRRQLLVKWVNSPLLHVSLSSAAAGAAAAPREAAAAAADAAGCQRPR